VSSAVTLILTSPSSLLARPREQGASKVKISALFVQIQ
jgi:hypothetical protein